jgi:hypothetical protein
VHYNHHEHHHDGCAERTHYRERHDFVAVCHCHPPRFRLAEGSSRASFGSAEPRKSFRLGIGTILSRAGIPRRRRYSVRDSLRLHVLEDAPNYALPCCRSRAERINISRLRPWTWPRAAGDFCMSFEVPRGASLSPEARCELSRRRVLSDARV